MKKKPVLINVITAGLLWVFPAWYFYQLAIFHFDASQVMTYFIPESLVLAVLSIPVAFGIWKVRPMGFFMFLAYATSVVLYSLYNYLENPILTQYVELVGLIVLCAGVAVILQKHISAPYFNPQIRWWETDTRYQVPIKASLNVDGQNIETTIADISKTGCFIETDTELKPGDTVRVSLRLLDFQFDTSAKVVWEKDNVGYGLMFLDVTGLKKKEIKNVISYLESLNKEEVAHPAQNVG